MRLGSYVKVLPFVHSRVLVVQAPRRGLWKPRLEGRSYFKCDSACTCFSCFPGQLFIPPPLPPP